MRKILLLAIGVSCFMASCKKDKDDSPDPSKARVMFLNATLGVDTVQVKSGSDVLVNSLLPFVSSGYRDLTPGETKISFVQPQTNIELSSTTHNFTANNYYSVFSGGSISQLSTLIISDDLSAPETGKAKVRLVNLAVENLNETFYIGSEEIASNIGNLSYSPFRPVSAGTYNLLVQDPANPTKIAQLSGQKLEPGKIYTVVVSGSFTGSGNAALKLTVLNNN